MNKKWMIITIIVIGFLIFINFFELRTVSTNKDVYSVGEPVKINWDLKTFYYCGCIQPSMYRLNENGDWEFFPIGGCDGDYPFCDNNTIINISRGGLQKPGRGVDSPCEIGYIHKSGTRSRATYWCIAKEGICEGKEGVYEVIEKSPPGKYKATFGYAEKIFEIR